MYSVVNRCFGMIGFARFKTPMPRLILTDVYCIWLTHDSVSLIISPNDFV